MISPGVFFIFDISIFRAVRGVKGKKWPKMTKQFCLLNFISPEPFIISMVDVILINGTRV